MTKAEATEERALKRAVRKLRTNYLNSRMNINDPADAWFAVLDNPAGYEHVEYADWAAADLAESALWSARAARSERP